MENYIFDKLVKIEKTLVSSKGNSFVFNSEDMVGSLYFFDEKNNVAIWITPFFDGQENIPISIEIAKENENIDPIYIELPMTTPTTTTEADRIVDMYFDMVLSVINLVELIYIK